MIKISNNNDNQEAKNIEIKGHKISVINNEVITINDLVRKDLLDWGISNAEVNAYFSGNEYKDINIGVFKKVSLLECEVEWRHFLSTNTEIYFEKCIFNGDVFVGSNNIKIKFSAPEKSNITLDGRNAIFFKNTDLTADLGSGTINVEHLKDEEVRIDHNNDKIHLVNGRVKSISNPANVFNIKSPEGCMIGEFNNGGNLKFTNLGLNRNSTFSRNGNNLFLNSLKLRKLLVANFQLQLSVHNLDFYETDIIFEESSSLNIKELDSMATVWNPSKIRYRGFCPSERINKNLKVNDILAAQEFFSEMKEHFSKRGNGIVASEFYAAEMKAYRAYLIKKHWLLHHDRFTSFWSFATSDFNQNWARAFWIYIGTSLLFAMIFAVPDYVRNWKYLDFNLAQLKLIYLYVNYYADILSPLSVSFGEFKKDSSNLADIPDWIIFFWMLWKIIAGYLIYQMVVSSRRFLRFQ